MLPSLDNFVSFGSDVIKARADYKQMLFEIYRLAMCSDQLGENDRVNGSKLAESMLLNLRGSLDDVCFLFFFCYLLADCKLRLVSSRYHYHLIERT